MEPADVTFQQLEQMTNRFAEARKLGAGSFGEVYKGVDKNGEEVAVKLLYNVGLGLDDTQFKNEFDNLRRLSHPNIVKLHSYCYETQHIHMQHDGKAIFAETIKRALCLEYLQYGSLEKHLSEESDGLDWHTRYDIIKGTCEGIKYLHMGSEKPVYHLDLKPDNILLDKKMVPKLADFGLSMVLGEDQTLVAQDSVGGTLGYMPPEFIEKHVISKMFDIFSLGVVVIKIIAGPNGRTKSAEMPSEDFMDLVERNWRKRLQETWSGSSLEAYCQQVKRCTEIALKCLEVDRHKRPTIMAITDDLNEMESYTKGYIAHNSYGLGTLTCGGLLSVHPLQLRFPLHKEYSLSMSHVDGLFDKVMMYQTKSSCRLHLTNSSDEYVAFVIRTKSPTPATDYFMGPLWGVVPPRSKYTRLLTMSKPPASMYQYLTLDSSKMDCEDMRRLFDRASVEYCEEDCRSVFKRAKEKGSEVYHVKLLALYERPGVGEELIKPGFVIDPIMSVSSLDLHPTEPWMLATRENDLCDMVYLWNYDKQGFKGAVIKGPKAIIQPSDDTVQVTTAKFVAKKWFVVGDTRGRIFVYTYDPIKQVRCFDTQGRGGSEITSFATHPTKPYVLAASSNGRILLLNHEIHWELIMKVYSPSSDQYFDLSKRMEVSSSSVSRKTRSSPTEEIFSAMANILKKEFPAEDVSGFSKYLLGPASTKLSTRTSPLPTGGLPTRRSSEVGHVVFHPNDNVTFASATSEGRLEIWNMRPGRHILKISDKVTCMDYFGHGDEQYLITCSGSLGARTAEIWDFRSESFFLTLEGHTSYVNTVCIHPSLPIFITGSSDGTIRLWNSATFRLEGTLNFGLGRVRVVRCLKGSRRIAIGCEKGIVLMEIDTEEPVVSM